MESLWVAVVPSPTETRLLAMGPIDAVLKGRLSGPPKDPRALAMLLEGLARWHNRHVRAVVAVDTASHTFGSGRHGLQFDVDAPLYSVELRWGDHMDLSSFADMEKLLEPEGRR